MRKVAREFIDREHEVMDEYYELCEIYNGRNTKSIKKRLKELIKKDPNFLDPYLFLYELLQYENKFSQAEKLLDEAYKRAIRLITDEKSEWPDILEWGWLQNRHIIRTIINKAVSLWEENKTEEALTLLRKLLKTNPNDNPGVRYYILAIRMGMSLEEFETRFDRDGYYDMEIVKWFDKNYKKFPGEFSWWEKTVEELE